MSDLPDLRAGLQHLLAHLSPTSGYGRLYQGKGIEDTYLTRNVILASLFPGLSLAHHVGPQGITSAIHPFVRLLRDAVLADDGIIGLGFLRSEPGAIWPYFRDKYNEVYFFTGCSWNSGEGGRGYQDMQAIFGFGEQTIDWERDD